MKLEELTIYRESKDLSELAWSYFKCFDVPTKKIIGDQWIRAIDSVSANYNARGSLFEAVHWTDTLKERGMIGEGEYADLSGRLEDLGKGLNAYIKATKALSLRSYPIFCLQYLRI